VRVTIVVSLITPTSYSIRLGATPPPPVVSSTSPMPLSALRADTKAPYQMNFHRKILRALKRPKAVRIVYPHGFGREVPALGDGGSQVLERMTLPHLI
jgi:hypothetical protein